jgi:hypothetical protein
LAILIWLATRLWQRASEARWYHEYLETVRANSPEHSSAPSAAAPAPYTPAPG